MKFMLDSNVLRSIAANDAGFWRIIEKVTGYGYDNLCLSAIVAAELHKAANNHKLTRKERDTIKAWMELLKIVPFGADAAQVSGELAAKHSRLGGAVTKPDYMIAGHAVQLGCVIVTNNIKHFEGFPSLKIQNWIKPATPNPTD